MKEALGEHITITKEETSTTGPRAHDDDVGMDDDSNAYIKNLGDTQGHKISDWVQIPGPHNGVVRHLNKFLRTFKVTAATVRVTNKQL